MSEKINKALRTLLHPSTGKKERDAALFAIQRMIGNNEINISIVAPSNNVTTLVPTISGADLQKLRADLAQAKLENSQLAEKLDSWYKSLKRTLTALQCREMAVADADRRGISVGKWIIEQITQAGHSGVFKSDLVESSERVGMQQSLEQRLTELKKAGTVFFVNTPRGKVLVHRSFVRDHYPRDWKEYENRLMDDDMIVLKSKNKKGKVA